MTPNRSRTFGCLLLAALLPGCARKAPPPPIVEAAGVVRLDGKPLNKAQVRFVPLIDYGPEYVAAGVTDESGRFQLTCHGQPGACACENRVLVLEAEIPARLKSEDLRVQDELASYLRSLGGRPLPPKYANLVTSPLTITVTAGQKDYPIDLAR
jgi:hypothetical protein